MQSTLLLLKHSDTKESQSCAKILSKMYREWATKNGCFFTATHTDNLISIKIRGKIGKTFKSEIGYHRICRASPFDPQKRRQTTFIEVEVNGACAPTDSVIRSYIFSPYQLVKDYRKDIEITELEKVLKGEIDLFLD